jgi:hypothetical protein
MNIKSLILGSAVSALAVTGAKAADAIIIAEPEPVEYVRVCDVYGAGFFYIPGTETCLRISGYVYHQIGATSADNLGDTPSWAGGTGTRGDAFTNRTRARVNFDARSETQYGTLRSYIRVQSELTETNYSQDGNGVFDQAWLSLGGFLAGYTESAFHNSNLVGSKTNGTGFADDALSYAKHQRQLIQYNFSGSNGFFAVASLENDPDDNDYVPDFVGKVGIQQGWGAACLTVGVDQDNGGLTGLPGDTEFAVKAGLHYNVPGAPGSAFRLVGHYNSDPNSYQQQIGGSGWLASEWSVYAGYIHQFNPQVAAWIGAAYYDDVYVSPFLDGAPGWSTASSRDGFHVETGLTWEPVKNFEVRAEAVYTKVDNFDGTVSGFLRSTRSF